MLLFCNNGKHAPSLKSQKQLRTSNVRFTGLDWTPKRHIHAQIRKHLPQQRLQPTRSQLISQTVLGDYILFDFISFTKQYSSQITYFYHGQKVAFNTMALFIMTGLDQLRHLYILTCIKKDMKTHLKTYKYRQTVE